MATWTPVINKIVNVRDNVSSEVLSPILDSFTNRTQYLYDRFADLEDKSTLVAFAQEVVGGNGVDQYSVVYYDGAAVSLKLAQPGIESGHSPAMFKASNSSYVLGIVKTVPDTNADVWIQGVIKSTGILAAVIDGSPDNYGETSGPLFLSSTEPGKLTFTPGGLAIFVAYAKNANELYLNPTFDTTNELFLNYKFSLLDRPAGQPAYSSVWTINSPNTDIVGWLPVSSHPDWGAGSGPAATSLPAYANAPVFYYNIPTEDKIDIDPGLNVYEKSAAKALRLALPPNPAGFTLLAVNGVLQLQKAVDIEATAGTYFVNEYGIWWYGNTNGNQPWANDILSSGGGYTTPANWATEAKRGTANLRPRQLLMFVKLNPGYRAGVVTSLRPFKTANNDSSNSLKFYNVQDPTSEQRTGDLLAKFNLLINSTVESPVTAYAIKSLVYNEVAGRLDVKTSPVVTGLVGQGGIKILTNGTTGVNTISSVPSSIPSLVNAVEPENTRLEFIGLNSCLTFDWSRLPCGYVGKFILPPTDIGQPLKLTIFMMGRQALSSSSHTNIRLLLEYSVMAPTGIMSASTTTNTFTYTLPGTYAANTVFAINDPSLISPISALTIPSSLLVPGGIFNFRIKRPIDVASDAYNYSISVIGTYWSIG